MSRPERVWVPALLVALALGAWLAVRGSARLPDGPVEPDWDHSVCARCGMLISERGFAAQVQLRDGRVLHYDDPGCLLSDWDPEDRSEPGVHAVWFHHRSEPRWLSAAEVGFEPAAHTPMNFGLDAVERARNPDSIGLDAARALARQRAGSPR